MKVYDEREAFYQWDLNQKIKSQLFKEGDEVHFGQSRSSVALVVKTYKEGDDIVADVPNVLLQSTRKIFAFQYVKDGEREYTTNERTFAIIPRPKPEDYVYTETEILRVEDYVHKALKKAKESGTFDGRGIKHLAISVDGELVVTYTNDQIQNLGAILTPKYKSEIVAEVLQNFVDVSEVGQ